MNMKKSLIIIGLIICIILIVVVVNFFNPPKPVTSIVGSEERAISMAKDTSDVKRFLTLYPDANISVYYISCNGAILGCHRPLCGNVMGGTSVDYYVIELKKGDLCLGVTIKDKGASIDNIELIRKDPEHPTQEIHIPTDSLYNDKFCYHDDDCKCWFGCGCDIPPKRKCVCETDEYYCLNYLYTAENGIHGCNEGIKCRCIDNRCTLTEEDT